MDAVPGLDVQPGLIAGELTEVAVDTLNDGTWSGDMPQNAGLAAVNDGETSENANNCARGPNPGGSIGEIVIDWGAGNEKIIAAFEWFGPNDADLFDGGTGTIEVFGSTDDFSTSNVELFSETGIAEPGSGGTIQRDLSVTTTPYRYHKWEISSGGKPLCAELEMTELV